MEFDWDDGNIDKNLKHNVHDWEIEEALLDPRRRLIGRREIHGEMRYELLGRSRTSGKYLRVVYTIRTMGEGKRKLRPISAVEMTSSEKRRYSRK
jgi:uncharacterized DUF497 family protein